MCCFALRLRSNGACVGRSSRASWSATPTSAPALTHPAHSLHPPPLPVASSPPSPARLSRCLSLSSPWRVPARPGRRWSPRPPPSPPRRPPCSPSPPPAPTRRLRGAAPLATMSSGRPAATGLATMSAPAGCPARGAAACAAATPGARTLRGRATGGGRAGSRAAAAVACRVRGAAVSRERCAASSFEDPPRGTSRQKGERGVEGGPRRGRATACRVLACGDSSCGGQQTVGRCSPRG